MSKFELDIPISGKNTGEYMTDLIERNDRQEVAIERGKLTVSILQQINKRSRLLLDAANYELRKVKEQNNKQTHKSKKQ